MLCTFALPPSSSPFPHVTPHRWSRGSARECGCDRLSAYHPCLVDRLTAAPSSLRCLPAFQGNSHHTVVWICRCPCAGRVTPQQDRRIARLCHTHCVTWAGHATTVPRADLHYYDTRPVPLQWPCAHAECYVAAMPAPSHMLRLPRRSRS